MSAARAHAADQRCSPDAALAEEARAIEGGGGELAALCLSGGGIRSAAFSLGVLQGLARRGLLRQFHYLSTVSGGGYIGGYLTARIHELGFDVDAVERELCEGNERAAWLARLRRAGNFLTPERGAASVDTWTGVTLYVRNLLLTWLSLLPWLVALVLVFVMYRTVVAVAAVHQGIALAALGGAVLGLLVSTYWLCDRMPSHMGALAAWRDDDPQARERAATAVRKVAKATVGLAMLWPLLAPLAMGNWAGDEMTRPSEGLLGADDGLWLGGIYAVAVLGAYGAAWGRAVFDARRPGAARLFMANAGSWLLATALSAGLIWLGTVLLREVSDPEGRVQVVAVAAPMWLAVAMVFHAGTYMGLRLREPAEMAELDREWTARMSARVLRLGVAVALLGVAVLVATDWFVPQDNAPWGTGKWRELLTPLLTGPAAAWLGHQAIARVTTVTGTAPTWRDKALDVVLWLLAAVFAAALLAMLSAVMQSYVLGPVQQFVAELVSGWWPGRDAGWVLRAAWRRMLGDLDGGGVPPVPPLLMVLVQAAGLALVLGVGWALRIDNNRFTLHGVYRNRLVRGFLGAARPGRKPEPVTGFDEADDVRMAEMLARDGAGDAVPRRLFPVVNMAVNLTHSDNPQWAERKALSFVATPLHCGYFVPHPLRAGVVVMDMTYVPTLNFHHSAKNASRHGIGLGTAMTISGAAASPNAGYHSQAGTAFLMTLFNLRLGMWVPNPAKPARREGLSPVEQVRALGGDLLGQSGIDGRAIYLSDGGHFDNLGLYEMLRRRCLRVVVVDASQDTACGFEDLGRSVRQASIDLGVTVEIQTPRIGPRGKEPRQGDASLRGCAVGTIHYPATDTQPEARGTLLYFKPSWLAAMPVEVSAYGAAEAAFPHQSTGDQWFSESQFEAYRRLGEFQVGVAAPGAAPATVEELIARAAAVG